MKTKTSFGRLLGILLKRNAITQTQLAERTGIAQATISNIIGKNKLVADSVMRSLCSCWPSRADNIQLLIAGLSDVIRRWGFDPDADVEVRPLDAVAAPTPTQGDLDLDTLRAHLDDEAVSELVHGLANLLRRHDDKVYPLARDRSGHGAGTAAELKPFA